MSSPSTIRNFSSPAIDLDNCSLLVTGATGSFGKGFVKNVLRRFKPKKLIVFSRDELKQFDMANEFPTDEYPALRFFIGDVRDRDRLEMAMRDVDYVIHAAAMKQVPTAEYNPMECINTNVIGAENIVQAAIRCNVKKIIALSTDKAANPINLYGASKLASDKIFVAANNLSGADGTRFSVVRYGNVLGSRGSVVPFFRKLMAEGAQSLPITDPEMTRFWITLNQGIDFVLSSLQMMKGGEIFVPKIPSMKIVDMAAAMAPGIATHNVGIRPGEKLHEIMVPGDDARTTLELSDRFVIAPAFSFWNDEEYTINGANKVADNFAYSSDANQEWLDADGLQAMLDMEDA
ncbi:MAG: UDP-N-acetylglucosamine 4,6-dehydratase (inverting) [Rhodospirillales bacterium]|nr:UDP-N-acetylglucosamine 4,6-dehydratase (inverting) [Rhodospirillales bacterium]